VPVKDALYAVAAIMLLVGAILSIVVVVQYVTEKSRDAAQRRCVSTCTGRGVLFADSETCLCKQGGT
jgi:hypothetical protein